MLVLSRKVGERLVIGDDVVVVITKVTGNRVTLAIEAPDRVRVVRGELSPRPAERSGSEVVGNSPAVGASHRCAASATVSDLTVVA